MKSEEALKKAYNRIKTELEARKEALEEFLYLASHDLQEPLRKIQSYGQLLEKDLDEQNQERIQDDLHHILKSADRMRTLIQSLLELSRVGDKDLDRSPISVEKCVEQALEQLEVPLEERNVIVKRSSLPIVLAEETLIIQLYQNLIGNAIKYNDSGRTLIEFTAESNDEMCVLGVKDNGKGIDPSHQEKIFKPFQRLEGRDGSEGTGIGLALCQRIIRRHGGNIWVDSEPGEGSHFKFTLPREPS